MILKNGIRDFTCILSLTSVVEAPEFMIADIQLGYSTSTLLFAMQKVRAYLTPGGRKGFLGPAGYIVPLGGYGWNCECEYRFRKLEGSSPKWMEF